MLISKDLRKKAEKAWNKVGHKLNKTKDDFIRTYVLLELYKNKNIIKVKYKIRYI